MPTDISFNNNNNRTHQWLRIAGLKAEIDDFFILAIEDESLLNRNFQQLIMKNCFRPKLSLCDKYPESTDHFY